MWYRAQNVRAMRAPSWQEKQKSMFSSYTAEIKTAQMMYMATN